jgi:hypothetical protein
VLFLLFSCTQPGDDTNLDPVAISNFERTGSTENDSMSFAWQTDIESDCSLHYGPYAFYGLVKSASSVDYVTHSITIDGLRPHTDYNMYVHAVPSSPEYATANSGSDEYRTLTYPRGSVASTGWESVGALCFRDSNAYYGPFCTAVLIDSEWVLTAAHCLEVEASFYGIVPDTANTVFYIGGTDASPDNTVNEPSEGDLYEIDHIVIHPDYSEGQEHDLALLHLTNPVPGITPANINTVSMVDSDIGSSIDMVGFDSSLTCVKKEQGQEIGGKSTAVFYTPPPPYHSFLLGDSGIAAFDDTDFSTILGIVIESIPEADNPFLGYALFTRVDVYSTWINGILDP